MFNHFFCFVLLFWSFFFPALQQVFTVDCLQRCYCAMTFPWRYIPLQPPDETSPRICPRRQFKGCETFRKWYFLHWVRQNLTIFINCVPLVQIIFWLVKIVDVRFVPISYFLRMVCKDLGQPWAILRPWKVEIYRNLWVCVLLAKKYVHLGFPSICLTPFHVMLCVGLYYLYGHEKKIKKIQGS